MLQECTNTISSSTTIVLVVVVVVMAAVSTESKQSWWLLHLPPPWCQQKGTAKNFEGAPTTPSTRRSGKECNCCCHHQRQAQQGKWGWGQLGWKGGGAGWKGGDGNGNDKDDNNDGQQLHGYKKSNYMKFICLFFCNSCCAEKAT